MSTLFITRGPLPIGCGEGVKTRREILAQLEPKIMMLPAPTAARRDARRCRRQEREKFLHRHDKFDRADAFVLGLAAGASLVAIAFALINHLSPLTK